MPLAEGVLGEVEDILIGVGDSVEEGSVVAVIETDKVSLDIKSSASGVVEEVLVEVGDKVKESQPLFALQPPEA